MCCCAQQIAKISFRQSLRITFAGLFASNFLPTTIGGDVVRLAGAIQYELDAATSTASLVVDRLVGMAGMAMMVPFSLPSLMSYREASFQGMPDHIAMTAMLAREMVAQRLGETLQPGCKAIPKP